MLLKKTLDNLSLSLGRGGGQVVSVLAFYSDDPSSNPAEVYNFFSVKLLLKRTKINKKEAGLAHFKNLSLSNPTPNLMYFCEIVL